MNETSPTVLDLFCGAGGFSLGFQFEGYEIQRGVDKSESATTSYSRNISPSVDTRQLDLSTCSVSDVIGDVQPDVVIGGSPCRGFSHAGEREENDERNDLVFDFWRHAKSANPSVVVMENVPGFLSMPHSDEVLDTASEQFPTVEVWKLSANDYSVPQTRDRVFVVAHSNPRPLGEPPVTSPVDRTVREAIEDLPHLEAGEESSVPNHVGVPHEAKTIERLENTRPGEPIWDSYSQRKRLEWDEPSPTILGNRWGFGHPGQPRALSLRERLRLQSAPDSFRVWGTVRDKRRQTADLVPPRLAGAIARQIEQVLE